MNPLEVARLRLYSQQIAAQKFKNPAQVVASLGAIQAQDYAGAKWSIGLRLPDATDADIEQAIVDRKIVRTWPMRGTLHFVAAADIRWMLALLTPRIIAGSAARRRQLELDDQLFVRSKKIFTRALEGGRQLSREAMSELLEKSGIPMDNHRAYHILWRHAQEGLLCFGARDGSEKTFVLLDEWVPAAKNPGRDEALAKLAKCYFTGHGPATLQDFVWWTGLKVADAKAALEMAASKLAKETISGKTYWMSPDVPSLPKAATTSWLLPGFDEYMLGYTDRSASLDPRRAQKICPGSNGIFSPTLVMDGRVVGTWKRAVKKGTVAIAAAPFTSLSAAQKRAIAAPAERYGKFIGLPATVT